MIYSCQGQGQQWNLSCTSTHHVEGFILTLKYSEQIYITRMETPKYSHESFFFEGVRASINFCLLFRKYMKKTFSANFWTVQLWFRRILLCSWCSKNTTYFQNAGQGRYGLGRRKMMLLLMKTIPFCHWIKSNMTNVKALFLSICWELSMC